MGKVAARFVAEGDGWSASECVCTHDHRDRPFEERHDAPTLAAVLAGSFQYRSARGRMVLTPGAILLGSAGECFECRHEYGTGDHCLSLHFAPEWLDRNQMPPAFPVSALPPLQATAGVVVDAAQAVRAPLGANGEEIAYGLLAAVATALPARARPLPLTAAADERRIAMVMRYIAANLDETLGLARLAAEVNLSKFAFLRTFRRVSGITPHQFILRARLHRAALVLRRTTEPVLAVALHAGFADLSNFIHAFRSEFGIAPRAYRRRS